MWVEWQPDRQHAQSSRRRGRPYTGTKEKLKINMRTLVWALLVVVLFLAKGADVKTIT